MRGGSAPLPSGHISRAAAGAPPLPTTRGWSVESCMPAVRVSVCGFGPQGDASRSPHFHHHTTATCRAFPRPLQQERAWRRTGEASRVALQPHRIESRRCLGHPCHPLEAWNEGATGGGTPPHYRTAARMRRLHPV
jgi:hypothetical protein